MTARQTYEAWRGSMTPPEWAMAKRRAAKAAGFKLGPAGRLVGTVAITLP